MPSWGVRVRHSWCRASSRPKSTQHSNLAGESRFLGRRWMNRCFAVWNLKGVWAESVTWSYLKTKFEWHSPIRSKPKDLQRVSLQSDLHLHSLMQIPVSSVRNFIDLFLLVSFFHMIWFSIPVYISSIRVGKSQANRQVSSSMSQIKAAMRHRFVVMDDQSVWDIALDSS